MKKILCLLFLIWAILTSGQKIKNKEKFLENIKVSGKIIQVYTKKIPDEKYYGFDTGSYGEIYIFYWKFKGGRKELKTLAKIIRGEYSQNKIKRESSYKVVGNKIEISERIFDYHFPSNYVKVLKISQHGEFEVVSQQELQLDEEDFSDDYVKQYHNIRPVEAFPEKIKF